MSFTGRHSACRFIKIKASYVTAYRPYERNDDKSPPARVSQSGNNHSSPETHALLLPHCACRDQASQTAAPASPVKTTLARQTPASARPAPVTTEKADTKCHEPHAKRHVASAAAAA